jgi:hypothetical protein
MRIEDRADVLGVDDERVAGEGDAAHGPFVGSSARTISFTY